MATPLVETPEGLAELLRALAGEPILAVDTEAASFHRYHDRIYLIQVSTASATVLIDPLGVGDLGGIGAMLADDAVEKVFHDADYDLRLFDKEFGFRGKRIFDTRIAAQFLNEPGIGLAALLEKYLGVKVDKRFQRADWSMRPLSQAMLDYAATDTAHLYELQLILRKALLEAGRLAWVEEECQLLEETRWTAAPSDPETDFLRLKGARALDRRALAILQELHRWRSETASREDRAEFRIVGNEVLLHLAQHPVGTREELARVRGIGRDNAERRGSQILAAIDRGGRRSEAMLPRIPRPPRRVSDPGFDARLEGLKRERNLLAARLELAPGVLCPNGTLESIARAEPDSLAALSGVSGVRHWQVEVIGAPLLKAMLEARPRVAKEV
ncbi:MAG: ribonuclease D [Gemmatimonadales bacterium]